jgi:hypothetical protein
MGRTLSIQERAAKAKYPQGRKLRFFDDGAAVEPGEVSDWFQRAAKPEPEEPVGQGA